MIVIYFASESAIWVRLGREGPSLLHTVSPGLAQLRTGGSVSKMALSDAWQAGAGCWLEAQPGIGEIACVPLCRALHVVCAPLWPW